MKIKNPMFTQEHITALKKIGKITFAPKVSFEIKEFLEEEHVYKKMKQKILITKEISPRTLSLLDYLIRV